MMKSHVINSIKPNEEPLAEKDHLRKMFIGGLAAVTNEDSLRVFYSQWGDVIDAVVMRDPATKRSRGFGFITYMDPMMVDKAQEARPHFIDGKSVDSKRALPRLEVGKTDSNSTVKKIFVGGLKENHDEQSLTEHFSQFGNIVNVKILTDKNTGRKRGFAFIEFDDYDAVDKAVLHKNHTIKFVLVDVKKSVYKQELAKKIAAQQQQQHHHNGMMTPNNIGGPGTTNGYPQQVNVSAYSPAAYAYPSQVPPQAYNGWGGYTTSPATSNYQQAPSNASVAGYGAYVASPQTGAAGWDTSAYVTQTGWVQNGYSTPPSATAASAISSAQSSARSGWNSEASQNFGDYQQTYNGGPQKAGNLQGNRMNPYSVTSAPNYGI